MPYTCREWCPSGPLAGKPVVQMSVQGSKPLCSAQALPSSVLTAVFKCDWQPLRGWRLAYSLQSTIRKCLFCLEISFSPLWQDMKISPHPTPREPVSCRASMLKSDPNHWKALFFLARTAHRHSHGAEGSWPFPPTIMTSRPPPPSQTPSSPTILFSLSIPKKKKKSNLMSSSTCFLASIKFVECACEGYMRC